MLGNLNTARYHEAKVHLEAMRGKLLGKMEMGLLGRCPRCDTDGPCLEEKSNAVSWEWDWSPGDTCSDRPFKDEETAIAYLNDRYFCTGAELVRFWHKDIPVWAWKATAYSDEFHDSSVFGLMRQIGTVIRDFRRDGANYHANWAKRKLQEMLEAM